MRNRLLVLIIFIFLFSCEQNIVKPEITLIGDEEVTIEVNSEYQEYGALGNYKDQEIDVTISGEVNSAIVGEYILYYDASINNIDAERKTRVVNVVDTTIPSYEKNDDSDIVLPVKTSNIIDIRDYFNFNDNYNSPESINLNIIGNIDFNTVGVYNIDMSVVDSSGNESLIKNFDIYIEDLVSPSISLSTTEEINIEAGSSFPYELIEIDENYYSEDVLEFFINDDLTAVGQNDITIYCIDPSHNISNEIIVSINVIDTTPPVINFSALDDFTHELGVQYTTDYMVLYDNSSEYENITVIEEGTIDVNTLGFYELSYYAIDEEGNMSETITKTVEVIEKTELDYYERFMKDHTSLYSMEKFDNSYIYDPIESVYRGLVLNNKGEYEVVYYFFLHNYLDNGKVLRKIEFIGQNDQSISYDLDDEQTDFVFRIPTEFIISTSSITVVTYPHEDYNTTVPYWRATFTFYTRENLNPDFILTLDLKEGNLK